MWLLPTHNRIAKLTRLIDSLGDEDVKQPISVLLWKGDPAFDAYLGLKFPGNIKLEILDGDFSYCTEKLNWGYRKYRDAQFFGFIADDIVCVKQNQLAKLAEMAGVWNIVAMGDNSVNSRIGWPGHPVLGGKLVRSMGWFAFPPLLHNCIDSVWFDIACEFQDLHKRTEQIWRVESPVYEGEDKCDWDEAYKRVNTEKINGSASFNYDLFWCRGPERQVVLDTIAKGLDEDCIRYRRCVRG